MPLCVRLRIKNSKRKFFYRAHCRFTVIRVAVVDTKKATPVGTLRFYFRKGRSAAIKAMDFIIHFPAINRGNETMS